MDITKVNIPEKFKNHPLFTKPVLGTNFGFMSKRGYYLTDFAKAQPALMAKSGVNWTTLNMNFCQDNYFSQKVYLDFEFSSGEYELSETVKRLHDNGISVLFKPCLTPLDGGWMGLVNFPDTEVLRQIEGVENDYWGNWFKSFTEALKYFADFSERVGMDAMIIGAEYSGTERKDEHWMKVIEAVRQNYSNPISYETTMGASAKNPQKFLENVDFLCYSYYPPAAPPNMPLDSAGAMDAANNPTVKEVPSRTVEEMVEYMQPARDNILNMSKRFGNKPLALTEFGIRSAHGCSMQPFNFLWDSYYDGEEQANYLEAGFRTFLDLAPYLGFFWWKWDETQNRPHYKADPNGEMGFTIQGKPAEEVMRKWLQKLGGNK